MGSPSQRNQFYIPHYEGYNESMESPTQNVQIYESQVGIESNAKKPRVGNFSIEEDILLVEAWINTGMDPVLGNEQSKKTYWMRIFDNYHANKTFDTNRTQVSLTNRWSAIQKSVNKFCGCLAQIESVHQSGLTEQDKIVQAKELYRELNKTKTPFPFEHCWNVLKTYPKWSSNKEKPRKRSFANVSSPSTQAPINLGEDNISGSNFNDLERPRGRKAAKEMLNKQKSKDNVDNTVMWFLNEMNERGRIMAERKLQLMEISNAREEERIRAENERMRLEQSKVQAEEDKIMLKDTSGLSEVQMEYIRIRQIEILESRMMN